ncbi:MAG: four-helix bundle copper-binding protein [Legionellales bacterium]|jgi:hypothetical protein
MNASDMKECITACMDCSNECQKMLFNYCAEKGGEHTKQDHMKLMADCIQICQIAADFMIRHSSFHKNICELCAKICEACAESCENLKDKEMQKCAEVCRRCAESCRSMGKMQCC